MGCLLTTNKHPPSSKLHQHSSRRSSRTPPPVDVETVKEVLTETPNPIKPEHDPKNIFNFRPDISEIENTSTTTFDTTFDNDDYEAYRRKVIERSPSNSGNRKQVSGELYSTGKSPVRGTDQSPGRVRMVRETGFGSSGRRSPGSGNVSAARSRSPAKRTVVGGGGCGGGGRNEIGRSSSGRKTGRSPGRVGSDLNERGLKPELKSGRGSNRFLKATNNNKKDESLENPLVSLECFIFL